MVAGRCSFEGVVAVAELPRLAAALADDSGQVEYRLDFGAGELGLPELHVRARAGLKLTCQRTLEAFVFPAAVDTRLGMLADERDEAALPGDCEPLLLDHGAVLPRQVLEDELLLTLPLVPVKPGSEILQGEWNAPGEVTTEGRDEPVVHPFAGLRDLLEARDKN